MPVLCQLADPENYRVSAWNIAERPDDRAYWLGLFNDYPSRVKEHLRADGLGGADFEARWPRFLEDYAKAFEPLHRIAESGGPLWTMDLCRVRQQVLDAYGWSDPHEAVKRRENALAAALYPQVIEAIEALPPAERWDLLLRGVFAGNMFDLGSPKTIDLYERGEIDFATILSGIKPRPWFIDDADALIQRFSDRQYKQGLFFVDNAGSDIVLGVLPVARELARSGTRVVLSANTRPALNDIMHSELVPLLETLAERDPVLEQLMADDRLKPVESGGDAPLIDLSLISEDCNREAAATDLIVLEGMGRGVESNWHERFKCDVWRVAILKDESVVRWQGAELYDPVCRFDRA
jgi:uncharacterized protein with ATP-grasp and redox domains